VARDVDFNLTAKDKTGPALAAAERGFKSSQDRIRKKSEETSEKLYGNALVRAATRAAPRIVGTLVGAASQAASSSGPILAGTAIASAPIIAGTLSAAIIGGAGIGGVLGGVALVKDDPRIAAAGTQLGRNMLSNLKDFAQPFVTPTLAAIDTIDARFTEVGGNLKNIFANSARFVAPLTDGATRFLQGVVRGADALISRGAPVIEALSSGLSELGEDTQGFLTTISKGADGAAASVRQFTDLLGGTLAVTGQLINGINQVSGGLEKIGISPGILQLVGKISDAADTTGTFTRHTQGATTAVTAEGQAARVAAGDMTALEAGIRGNVDANVALYGSSTTAAQAVRDATKAIKDNGEGLSLNTERGIANRQALQNLASALNANYGAYVKVHGAGADANEVLIRNREAFIRAASAAGASAAKARQLANDLLGIPEKRQPKVELLDRATGKINNVINRLAAVKNRTVTLTVAVRQSGDAAALRKQSLPSGLSAQGYFAQTTGEGTYRTGGPTPVKVSSEVNVSLDGRPFYAHTTQAIAEDRARSEWRRRVGKR
jgi:hypothetical protein